MSNNRGMPSIKASQESSEVKASEEISEQPKLERSATEASIVKVHEPKSGIEVVAIRPGFSLNIRREVGDVFKVRSMEKLGDWMKCTDPATEMKHQAIMVERKKKKRAGF